MRFNIGISPKLLTDEHLFAESRELKFLPSYYGKYGDKGRGRIPEKFTLGTGHILFFAYKPTYSLARYKAVIEELHNRGINVPDESERWSVYGNMTDNYEPEGWESNLIRERIVQRIEASPKKYFHYNHSQITKQEAIILLNEI